MHHDAAYTSGDQHYEPAPYAFVRWFKHAHIRGDQLKAAGNVRSMNLAGIVCVVLLLFHNFPNCRYYKCFC